MTLLEHLAFLGRRCRQVGDGPIEYLDGLPAPTQEELDATREAALAYYSPPKIWPDTEHFLAEFTPPEMAGIGLSVDPTVAGLRFLLSGWRSAVHSDDPRVSQGLDALVSAGIISEERRGQILR